MRNAVTDAPTTALLAGEAEEVKALPDGTWPARVQEAFPVDAQLEMVLRRKLERRGRDKHATCDPVALGARLHAFLGKQVAGEFTVGPLAPLPGGASKEMYTFSLEWTENGVQRSDRMVLRMSPPAGVVETSRLQEAQMLRAVTGRIPVPECFWATEDLADFGEPVIITGLVTGVNAPTAGVKIPSGIGTGYDPALRDGLAKQFLQHLATLHTIDPSSQDLSAFELPSTGTTEAAETACRRWFRVWAEDCLEDDPTMALARRWLWENRPVLDQVSLTHGDYRNGNFLFDEASGDITAVLDWELAGVGDRHLDLSYLLLPMFGHDDGTGRFVCSGLIDRESAIAEYERLSGLTVDPDRLRWYSVLNLYWVATATRATGVRAATSQMTHLGVMLGFISAIASECTFDINRLVQEA